MKIKRTGKRISQSIGESIGWGIMTLLDLFIVLYALQYFSLNPDLFFPQQREVYIAHEIWIIIHVTGGVLALGIGPFLFLDRLMNRWPVMHRWLGRIYMTGILLGGLAGLYMAFYAYAGVSASLGFAGLAIAWLLTAYLGYCSIRAKRIAAHRRWMIRNFSLTFAAVTLRLWPFPLSLLLGEITGYDVVAWVCWIPNLIAAEVVIRGVIGRSKQFSFIKIAAEQKSTPQQN